MPVQPALKGKLLFQELLVFGLIQILSLWAGIRLFCFVPLVKIRVTTSLLEFVFVLVFSTTLLILLLHILKGGLFFKTFFVLAIFLGCLMFLSIFIPDALAGLLTIAALILLFIYPKVWLHNLVTSLALMGIGISFGLMFPVGTILILLFLLSLYDYVAVYHTKHMVQIFRGLLARKVIFALILPEKFKGWLADLRKIKPGTNFLFLGTGDIVLPLTLAVSALTYGLESAVFTVSGSLVGLVVLHVLFVSQPKREPMPALPPLAMFSVFGFLLSLFLK